MLQLLDAQKHMQVTDVPVAVDINVVLVDGAFHDIDSSK